MAGQFRSYQWDPVLIIAQIIAMQCLFYVGLGSCVAVTDFILGYSRSVSQLFLYQVHYRHHARVNPNPNPRLQSISQSTLSLPGTLQTSCNSALAVFA